MIPKTGTNIEYAIFQKCIQKISNETVGLSKRGIMKKAQELKDSYYLEKQEVTKSGFIKKKRILLPEGKRVFDSLSQNEYWAYIRKRQKENFISSDELIKHVVTQ
jgi:hypothetical protein